MKHPFTLPYFPDSTFEIETSTWTGRSKLWKDEELFERSSEKGKRFMVPNASGEVFKIYPKPSFPDLTPSLEINGIKHSIIEKLPWYQYAVAMLPMILIFIGGALGGTIGAVTTMYNLNTFRSEDSDLAKYIKVIVVSILAYVVYSVLAYMVFSVIN